MGPNHAAASYHVFSNYMLICTVLIDDFNDFRFADNKLVHLSHTLIGVVVVFACNAMVIVAIIAAIHSLLIP